jgi:non-specific serine/threonine protein kinase
LLALDNCDHVLKAKSELVFMLNACPNLKILATSREIFRLKWESIFPVSPLQVPDLDDMPDLHSLIRIPSVDLFVQQVKIQKKDFTLTDKNAFFVAELCARLDGLPHAIVLAASQFGILKPMRFLESLHNRLSLMGPCDRNIQLRHHTLRTAIDWSFAQLTDQEKILFCRLSVFPGPWTLQEAVGICSGDGLEGKDVFPLLERLVDCSLVHMNKQAGKGKKYRFLETIREFAWTKLQESGKEGVFQRQHRDWFLVWAEQGELSIWGPEAPDWLEQIEANYNNFWSAMEWCRVTPGEAQNGLRIWAAIAGFYDLKGHVAGGIAMARQLLTLSSEQSAVKARTLVQASVLARSQGEMETARLLAEECLSFSADLGDILDTVGALCTLGSLEQIRENPEKAESFYHEACTLSRMQYEREPRALYVALFWMGMFFCFKGRNEQAVSIFEEALTVARHQGDILFETRILSLLGRALIGKNDLKRAESVLTEGILVAKKLNYHEIIALCMDYLGQTAWAQGRRQRAVQLLGAVSAIRTHVGVVSWIPDPNYPLIASELGTEIAQTAQVLVNNLMPDQITAWALSPAGTRKHTLEMKPSSRILPGALTFRELEISRLITQGLSNRQIAEHLYISRRTVDAHVRHILVKLDINTRAQVSAWYTEHCSNSQRKFPE